MLIVNKAGVVLFTNEAMRRLLGGLEDRTWEHVAMAAPTVATVPLRLLNTPDALSLALIRMRIGT